MNCSRVRRSLPLLAGGDLSSRKAKRLEKHLAKCPGCRQVAVELKAALTAVRAIADLEAIDWPEAEWKAVMTRFGSERLKVCRRPTPLPTLAQRPWAGAAAMLLVLAATFLVLKIVVSPLPPARIAAIVVPTPAHLTRQLRAEEALPPGSPMDLPYKIRALANAPDRAMLAAKPAPTKATQDMMSMTLVSQKTGLQVHWTFNKDFEWEEKEK